VLNQRLADCCERVVLIVAGQPIWLKPAPTEASR
jgi:adenosyl cobinamide kinase/adenosyl cobinamide phosphate guanylyltransferase